MEDQTNVLQAGVVLADDSYNLADDHCLVADFSGDHPVSKQYLLLGATRKPYVDLATAFEPETVNPLLIGSAEEVIAAACAAPCGVLLVDLTSVPTARSLAQETRLRFAAGKS